MQVSIFSGGLLFPEELGNLGAAFSLGICPKFTPAPHFPASVGGMREGERETFLGIISQTE